MKNVEQFYGSKQYSTVSKAAQRALRGEMNVIFVAPHKCRSAALCTLLHTKMSEHFFLLIYMVAPEIYVANIAEK